jgi:hypothetical protein
MTNINDLLREHVTLDIECLDRIYLNGYVPTLQLPGQVVTFLVKHRQQPVPSPVLLGQMTENFRQEIKRFAEANQIPLVQFESGQRKDDLAAEYHQRFTPDEGVVFIGVAQEKAYSFKAAKKPATRSGFVSFNVAFEPLDNGFLSCADPACLQATCDELAPDQIQAFFDKWIACLPWPLTPEDRQAGYTHRLAIRHLEVSRTLIFAQPTQGRAFFEQVIRDNLDLGRPDRVSLIFDRKIIKTTPGQFHTRIIENGVHPSLHIHYKQTDLKQYFKEGRGLRLETTFKDPGDFNVRKDLSQLPYLQKIGRDINQRLLDVQRISQDCALSQNSVERIVQPTVCDDGQRASGLRFGDPRVMALLMALTLFLHIPHRLTARSLRKHVADLLGRDLTTYTSAQMTYDLRRLKFKGLIWRIPNTRSRRMAAKSPSSSPS